MLVDVATVVAWAKLQPLDATETDLMQNVIDATTAQIGHRCEGLLVDDDGGPLEPADWPHEVQQAAVIASARLYSRRNTPSGIETFPDVGEIGTVRRFDPDVESLISPYLSMGY